LNEGLTGERREKKEKEAGTEPKLGIDWFLHRNYLPKTTNKLKSSTNTTNKQISESRESELNRI